MGNEVEGVNEVTAIKACEPWNSNPDPSDIEAPAVTTVIKSMNFGGKQTLAQEYSSLAD